MNLSDFLDTGLFLDHRVARNWVRGSCKELRVLNLFAYTGSFSVYALAGGASRVTTVDMSKTYLDWASRNVALNEGLDASNHEIVQSDCLAWLGESLKKGEQYDLIICDPPTFSNSKRMKESSFSIDRDYRWLLADLTRLLQPEGRLFFSNNSRSFKLDKEQIPASLLMKEVSSSSVPEDFRNRKIHRSWWGTKAL